MKYGMRERVSGIVIIGALAVLILPMLFDAPDDTARPEGPVMSIEQPISVSQQEIDEPRSPLEGQQRESVSQGEQLFPGASDEIASRTEPELSQQTASPGGAEVEGPASNEGATVSSSDTASSTGTPSSTGDASSASAASERDSAPAEDPIMAAASGSAGRSSAQSSGEGWAVQAGSFGQPENADRLISQLQEQGFNAYQRPRGNLHTVYVGPFDSTEASEQARTRLQSRANIKGLIVRREGTQ